MYSIVLLSTLSFFAISFAYKPVDELIIPSYMGRWYQMYENTFDKSFQGNGYCAVADYTLNKNGNVNVLNSQTNKDRTIQQINGLAYYDDGNSGGELTVKLDGVPKSAAYWVLELGPIIDNQYQYSIVSDNNAISLFVLARNTTEYYTNYDTIVQASLKNLGFTNKLNKPIVMSQDNCDYDAYNLYDLYGSNNLMNKQSECQVATYLKNAGFSSSNIPTMVCISKYESSFNCDATNKNTDGSTDYGLFEINSYYWCSGDSASKYNECSATCVSLFDCQKNTNCAYKVWREQGYNAWYGYQYHKTECDNYKINC